MLALILSHAILLLTQLAWLVSAEGLGESVCELLTFVLHSSLLSSMGWMLVEGIILYKSVPTFFQVIEEAIQVIWYKLASK